MFARTLNYFIPHCAEEKPYINLDKTKREKLNYKYKKKQTTTTTTTKTKTINHGIALLSYLGQPGFRVKESLAFIGQQNRTFSGSCADEVTDIPFVFPGNVILSFWRWGQSFHIFHVLNSNILQYWRITKNITGQSEKRNRKTIRELVCVWECHWSRKPLENLFKIALNSISYTTFFQR